MMWGLVLNRYFLVAAAVAILTMVLVKKKREDSDFASNSIPSDADPGVTPSISHEKAKSHAQALFDAMDRFGTDTRKIWAVLEMLNPADWKMIDQAFGVKKYGLTGYDRLIGTERPLSEWLNRELSQTGRDKKVRERVSYLYEANGVIF